MQSIAATCMLSEVKCLNRRLGGEVQEGGFNVIDW